MGQCLSAFRFKVAHDREQEPGNASPRYNEERTRHLVGPAEVLFATLARGVR